MDFDSDYLDYGDTNDGIQTIFYNTALRLHDRLLDKVTGPSAEVASDLEKETTYPAFKSWATGVTEFDDSRDVFPLTLVYERMLWTGSTIRRRRRVLSGNQCYTVAHLPRVGLSEGSPIELSSTSNRRRSSVSRNNREPSTFRPQSSLSTAVVAPTVQSSSLVSSAPPWLAKERSEKTSASTRSGTVGSGASITLPSPAKGCPDGTVEKPKRQLSEHVLFARIIDWAATPLGPISSWSIQFREIANLVMRNPHAVSLFWDEELIMLYNKTYKNEVVGNKHPDLMGTGFSGPFSELWDRVAPFFREYARTGQSVRKENHRLPIEKYGYLEETFFS